MAHTVLVVDDDPDFLDLVGALLQQAGYEMIRAEGAFRAMELLERRRPDAMVLDIMMPDRTGIEVLEQVRWNPELADLPVLCITAVHIGQDPLEFIREFSVGLLDKARITELVDHLRDMIPANGNAPA